jgi:hypothetical protein
MKRSRKAKENKPPAIFETLGWFGAILIVVAYALLSLGIVSSRGYAYHILSGLGAAGLVADAYSKKDYPPMWLNLLFGVIAVAALASLVLH